MSRHRYEDMRRAGRSAVVSYIPGEDPAARHDRRERKALEMQEEVRVRVQSSGGTLEIKNGGMHWIIRGRNGFRAEWWPGTAKCVLNQEWSRGIHVHDIHQLIRLVLGRL